MTPLYFITGIGTDVGKTLAAAIVTKALEADYWKPIQAGFEHGTDSSQVKDWLAGTDNVIHPEVYRLQMPASPHIAARQEGISISINQVKNSLQQILSGPHSKNGIVIEGAGGLMVPLNEQEFVADLAQQLQATVILVSRNYLGSINHSLLTAKACALFNLPVAGWLFNDQYLAYEEEIAHWSGYPTIGSIPFSQQPDAAFIAQQAALLQGKLKQML